MMSINTDEVNFLVYRYLEESGFHHSAYLFGYESSVITAGIDGTLIPRGALLSLLQKSVLFAEAEVFSLLSESEIDSKFEKAVGSMSLLECTTTDAAKLKALERVREDMSRVCSPHPSTSAPQITMTSNSLSTTTTSLASTNNSDVVASTSHSVNTFNNATVATTASLSNKTGTLSIGHNTALGSSLSTNPSTSTDIHTLTTSATSLTTPSAHHTAGNNGGDAVPPENFLNVVSHYSMTTALNTSTATVTHAGKSSQFQRDREFRAKQSQQLQSGTTSGPPPRGPYRTATNDYKNSISATVTHNYTNSGNTIYNQTRQGSGGTPPSQRPHQNLHNSSTPNSVECTSIQFINPTNGLSSTYTSSPLLQHHHTGKQVDANHSALDFLSSTTSKSLQQSQQQAHNQQQTQQNPRYLMNGNHLNAGHSAGRKAQGAVPPVTIAGNGSAGSGGATIGSGKSSVLTAPTGGSVYDPRFYCKENQ